MFTRISLLSLLISLCGSAIAATGDAAAGEKKAAMCIGCHGIPGYQASFPEVHKVPMISGQNAKYIASSLAAYQKGERHHPTMKAIAASLSEQDMLDLAAFYEQHAGGATAPAAVPAPSPEVAKLLQKGDQCASCHGVNFSKAAEKAPNAPKLAGQHPDYLYVALKSYQSANNPHVGRANPTMAGQVSGFSHAELKALAKYLGSLEGELKVVPQSRMR